MVVFAIIVIIVVIISIVVAVLVEPFYTEWKIPLLSIGSVHFRFKGCWVVVFIFFIFDKTLCKQTFGDPDLTPRSLASGLVLHCLHMSHKKDARLKWIYLTHFAKWFYHRESIQCMYLNNYTRCIVEQSSRR